MIPGCRPGRGNLVCRSNPSWLCRTSRSSLLAFVIAVAPLPSVAAGPPKPLKDQLVGTWTLVSIAEEPSGKDKRSPIRPSAEFTTTFAADGHVTSAITGAGTAIGANGNARPADLRPVTFSGTYAVNEADKTVTYQTERNWLSQAGQGDRKTIVVIKGNQFEQMVPSMGSSPARRFVWQRMK